MNKVQKTKPIDKATLPGIFVFLDDFVYASTLTQKVTIEYLSKS